MKERGTPNPQREVSKDKAFPRLVSACVRACVCVAGGARLRAGGPAGSRAGSARHWRPAPAPPLGGPRRFRLRPVPRAVALAALARSFGASRRAVALRTAVFFVFLPCSSCSVAALPHDEEQGYTQKHGGLHLCLKFYFNSALVPL